MSKFESEILQDIDATIEQLVENSEALKSAKMGNFFAHEVDALEKMQESLLARVMHRKTHIEQTQKKKMLDSIRKEVVNQKIADFRKKTSSVY